MAELTCPTCGSPVQPGDLICFECGANLARAHYDQPSTNADSPATAATDSAAEASGTTQPAAATATAPPDTTPAAAQRTCPHCGTTVVDPSAPVCLECLRPLEGAGTTAGVTVTFSQADSGEEISIKAGESLVFGRDPAQSPAAEMLARFDNISRRHATVTVSDTGEVRIGDANSTNGTFVNDHRVPAGQHITLFDGDTVRLAADCRLTVRIPA